jgi:hypothetical protein
MRLRVRAFIIMLLTAFAAATVAQTAAAAAMSAKMALAGAGGMEMNDCKDCPDAGKKMASCAAICASPLMILSDLNVVTALFAGHAPDGVVGQSIHGFSGPPDPYPPRSIVLS